MVGRLEARQRGHAPLGHSLVEVHEGGLGLEEGGGREGGREGG